MKSEFTSAWESPGFLLWHATMRWQRAMRAALAPHDLTHVQFVLLASAWWLGEQGEQPSQRRLAEHAGTDAMMTSQVARALERAGLVERLRDPADSRRRAAEGCPARRRGGRCGLLRRGLGTRARAAPARPRRSLAVCRRAVGAGVGRRVEAAVRLHGDRMGVPG